MIVKIITEYGIVTLLNPNRQLMEDWKVIVNQHSFIYE
jgi:hypothetical protein